MMPLLFLYPLPVPATKAIDAAYIQSGAAAQEAKVTAYFTDKYARPIYLDKAAALFVEYRKKELTVPIYSLKLNLRHDQVKLTIPF